ncbi:MAG TPA: S9 family peptidase [Allosphingosinicella sp.]|jgi:dipeptidyl aminopeptidase/acylaminoacyl peptidase
MRINWTLPAIALVAGTATLGACTRSSEEVASTKATPAPAIAAPLIPRSAIFGNPVRAAGRISPDGRYVSWLAPVDGVLNIFVAPASDPSAGRAVTRETRRNLQQYFWAPDSRHILFLQDSGGNENFHVHSVAATGGASRDLTPVAATVRAVIQGVSPLRPEVVLVGLNERNPQFFDLYEINYRTGERRLVQENPGYGGWIVDNQLRPRFATQQVPGGATKVFRRTETGTWTEAFEIPTEDFQTTNAIGFNRADNALYWIDSRGRNTAALVRMDPNNGQTQVIATNPRSDISNVMMDPRTFEPVAYSVNHLRQEWTPLNGEIQADLEYLRSRLQGDINIVSATNDMSKLIVTASAAESPASFYLYDRGDRNLRLLFQTRPDLSNYQLQPMHPVAIRSRDNNDLVSYLTLPPGSDANNDGRPERRVPMVLYVHGGPWARDQYGYNAIHQWLSNRGYAVLSVNYRGSTGFGKQFIESAVGQWAGAMHDDLIDSVDWAVERGVTSRDSVAIMGGSYGGYATLVGLTWTPDRFRCGVDLVGPSNLVTLMESFPAYWRPILAGTFYRHIGDPATPEGRARAMAQSPISRVDRIRVPLLIGQGQNDPRVVKAESDQIVAAMRARNLPVTYVNYPDEGHGFVRPPNSMSFWAITEAFLQPCLGGRVQPIGDDFNGSTLQVLEGAQHVPGLQEALARRPAGGSGN